MKRIAIFFLFFLMPAVCLAEEKVYTDSDLKPEPPIYSKSASRPQPQQQNVPIKRGFFEQRDPVSQPKFGTNPKVPQTNDDTRSNSDMNRTPSTASNPVNPFPAQHGTVEQALADAFARLTLLMLILVGIPFLIWLICLIDVLRNEFTGNNKVIWFLVVFFLPIIGSILYFFIGTDQKIRHKDEEEPVVRLI